MTQPEPQTYIYDPEVVDMLSGEVEALGLEIPRDPNSPDYEIFVQKLRAKDPFLATRVSLARVSESELRASTLLRDQARAIDGQESFMERITSRVTRRTPNGTPVTDHRLLGIIGGGLLIAALGAFLFWPRYPRTLSASTTTTPSATTQTERAQASGNTDGTSNSARLPTEPVDTSPLAAAPGSSTGPSTPGVGTGQTTAPTESQVTPPSYTAPSFSNDTSSSYSPPSSSSGVYTPPPVNSSSAYTPPPSGNSTPSVSSTVPDTASAPVEFAPPPTVSTTAATPEPNLSNAYTPPVTVPPATTPPTRVTENFPGSQPDPATAPATPAGTTSPSVTAGGAARGRINVVYAAAGGQQGEGQRTGRMAVLSVNGTGTGGGETSAAPSGSAQGQGTDRTGNPGGATGGTRSRNLGVVYDAKATNRITSYGPGQNQGQADTQAQAPQNDGQTAATGTTPAQAQDGRTRVLYSAPEQAGAPSAAQGNGQTSPGTSASASPFQMGQLIPANMMVALDLIEGASVEFFVNTPAAQGNYVWKGTATLDGSKRVQMNFTELALPDGQVVPVRASGVATDGTLGVKPGFRPSAPAAAIDAVRGTLSGVQEAANAQLQAGTTVVTGGATVVTKTPPNFWLSLLGGAVNSFKLPSTTASVVTLAHIDRGTPINILFSGSAAGDGAPR